jgi:hypothetical protein
MLSSSLALFIPGRSTLLLHPRAGSSIPKIIPAWDHACPCCSTSISPSRDPKPRKTLSDPPQPTVLAEIGTARFEAGQQCSRNSIPLLFHHPSLGTTQDPSRLSCLAPRGPGRSFALADAHPPSASGGQTVGQGVGSRGILMGEAFWNGNGVCEWGKASRAQRGMANERNPCRRPRPLPDWFCTSGFGTCNTSENHPRLRTVPTRPGFAQLPVTLPPSRSR